MNVSLNKIFKISLVILILVLFFNVPNSTALREANHREINELIAQRLFFDDYLKKQLGMKEGYNESIVNKKIFKWIGDGGFNEDAGARSLNHFLNPITNQGLGGVGYSASTWATLPVEAQKLENFSWNDVRDYYYKSLTSADKTNRDSYFTLTFQGVGQVMHLVQDMSVPAHTRNDSHLLGDDHEGWFLKSTSPLINTYSSQGFTPDNPSFLIPQLFDTDQYNGFNPSSATNIGLAEYTNTNFLSQGTIFTANFTYPAYSDMSPKVETDSTSGKQILYLSKNGHGESVEYFARAGSLYNYLPADYTKLALTLDDDKVHVNYAHFLIPRAIGYSSQVLSYFFRGQLEVEMGAGSLKVKNTSNETMTGGKFELYYDDQNGSRTNLTTSLVTELSPGTEQIIPFNTPQDATSYMLVYMGRLGSEPNAVVGKFIPAELVVITVSLSGISGESLTKKSVLVWNPTGNSLERAPVDYNDSDFQQWFSERNIVDSVSLFSNLVYDNVHPHILEPELIDIPKILDYHCNASSANSLFPESYYEIVSVPLRPPIYTGFRTSKSSYNYITKHIAVIKVSWIVWGPYYDHIDGTGYHPDIMEINYAIEEVDVTGLSNYSFDDIEAIARAQYPADYHNYPDGGKRVTTTLYTGLKVISSGSDDYKFFGPLGDFASFTANNSQMHWNDWPQVSTSTHFIPDWKPLTNPAWSAEKNYARGRYWYNSSLDGKYSPNTIISICTIQYTPCDYISTQTEPYGPVEESWTFGSRGIGVQAQALNTKEGTTGYDWVAAGRNAELEAQIIAAINMAYSLNGIPANEIRSTSIDISIVK